jgi:leucyl-tRNA synthetase
VPGHDERDHEFATKYELPIKVVVRPEGAADRRRHDRGASRTKARWSTRSVHGCAAEATRNDDAPTRARGIGEGAVQYRLKDWGISRQRYWGTPIPIVTADRAAGAGAGSGSAGRLPNVVEFTGRGDSPLAHVPEFVNATCPKCGEPAKRETDTMDTFVDSSWYFYRFCDRRTTAAVRSGEGRVLGAGRLLQRRRRARDLCT